MNVTNIYKSLFELLTAPHGDGDGVSALSAVGGTARRELLTVAKKEECLPDLYAQWEPEGRLSPSESDEHEQIQRRRKTAAALMQALPSGTILLGGAGMQHHCPKGVQRLSTDLQVLIADFGAIGALHEAVRQLGYRLRGSGEWLVPLRGPMHRGCASYCYTTASGNEGAASLEVQVAGVPVDARRNLPFAEFAGRTTKLDGLACVALDPTRQLLQCFADFGARDVPITIRRIADLHHLLKAHGNRVDHAALRRRVEQWDLWSGLQLLREAIVAKRLSAQLDWGELGQLIDMSASRSAAPAGRSGRAAAKPAKGEGEGGAPAGEGVGLLVKRAFDLFAGPRDDDLASKAARSPWLVSTVLNAGHRVRAVQVSSKSHGAPQLLRIDGSLYLATGAGLFLLSLVDLSDGARAELSERLRTARRPVVLARWTGASPAPSRERRREETARGSRPVARPSRG